MTYVDITLVAMRFGLEVSASKRTREGEPCRGRAQNANQRRIKQGAPGADHAHR
jgi:hypothetical protein